MIVRLFGMVASRIRDHLHKNLLLRYLCRFSEYHLVYSGANFSIWSMKGQKNSVETTFTITKWGKLEEKNINLPRLNMCRHNFNSLDSSNRLFTEFPLIEHQYISDLSPLRFCEPFLILMGKTHRDVCGITRHRWRNSFLKFM